MKSSKLFCLQTILQKRIWRQGESRDHQKKMEVKCLSWAFQQWCHLPPPPKKKKALPGPGPECQTKSKPGTLERSRHWAEAQLLLQYVCNPLVYVHYFNLLFWYFDLVLCWFCFGSYCLKFINFVSHLKFVTDKEE